MGQVSFKFSAKWSSQDFSEQGGFPRLCSSAGALYLKWMWRKQASKSIGAPSLFDTAVEAGDANW